MDITRSHTLYETPRPEQGRSAYRAIFISFQHQDGQVIYYLTQKSGLWDEAMKTPMLQTTIYDDEVGSPDKEEVWARYDEQLKRLIKNGFVYSAVIDYESPDREYYVEKLT